MLVNTEITIAYKCPVCGNFEFFGASPFTTFKNQRVIFKCRCGESSISIQTDIIRRSCDIIIPCIGCGGKHKYIVDIRDIIKRDITLFYCIEKGVQQCFIGNDEEVRRRVDNLEKEFDELINAFGYDSYFCNTQVMLDILNKIHDIAEEGNLNCECGNKDIELLLFSDIIFLKCKKCFASKVIFAASNKDLKEIMKRQQIFITGTSPL